MSTTYDATQNLIEHFCQWLWSQFNDVDNREEMNSLLDNLEAASCYADNGDRLNALRCIRTSIERVCGCRSYDYLEFLRLYFPEDLAWAEYFAENPGLKFLEFNQTQAEAIALMQRISKRAEETKSTSFRHKIEFVL